MNDLNDFDIPMLLLMKLSAGGIEVRTLLSQFPLWEYHWIKQQPGFESRPAHPFPFFFLLFFLLLISAPKRGTQAASLVPNLGGYR